MRIFVATAPLVLLLIIAALHIHTVIDPSPVPLTFAHHLLWGVAFATTFWITGKLSRLGYSTNAVNVYVVHLHMPRHVAAFAYILLAVSVALLISSLMADFNPRRRSSALGLFMLAGPSIVWLYLYGIAPASKLAQNGDA